MKTIIFSLTVMLAFMIGTASAQILNGYHANANANLHPGKGNVKIHILYVDPMTDVSWPNPTHPINIPRKQVAKYISPLGFLFRPSGNGGNTSCTTPIRQNKKTGTITK